MEKLSDLPNIGPIVEAQLNDVGIYSYDDLKKLVPKMHGYKFWKLILLRALTGF